MITRVGKVVVPVTDQQAAVEFWTATMGFELLRDDAYGSERWIEVRPPQQDLVLILTRRQLDEPRRRVPDELPHSDLFFDCHDIERTFLELRTRGVRFAQPPTRQDFGWWALFEDNEGSRYALGQWTAQEPDVTDRSAPTPHPSLRQLDVLVGTWRVEGESAPGFPGPTVNSISDETFEWLPGGFFLVHRWNSVFGDPTAEASAELPGGPIQQGIMFYGFDARAGRLRTHFFDGNGPFHDGNSYDGEVRDDGALVFTGPARFTITELDHDTLRNDWELPGEDSTWHPWRHTIMRRIQATSTSALW